MLIYTFVSLKNCINVMKKITIILTLSKNGRNLSGLTPILIKWYAQSQSLLVSANIDGINICHPFAFLIPFAFVNIFYGALHAQLYLLHNIAELRDYVSPQARSQPDNGGGSFFSDAEPFSGFENWSSHFPVKSD